MASNGRTYGRGAAWEQVGWYWWSGRLYLMTWGSDGQSNGEAGCPGTFYRLVPDVLKARASITVAVSRSGDTWKAWEKEADRWEKLGQVKFKAGPQTAWSTMLESAPGSSGSVPEVCFSARVLGRDHLPGGCS